MIACRPNQEMWTEDLRCPGNLLVYPRTHSPVNFFARPGAYYLNGIISYTQQTTDLAEKPAVPGNPLLDSCPPRGPQLLQDACPVLWYAFRSKFNLVQGRSNLRKEAGLPCSP